MKQVIAAVIIEDGGILSRQLAEYPLAPADVELMGQIREATE